MTRDALRSFLTTRILPITDPAHPVVVHERIARG
jgi:hypothetical protein